MPKKSSAYECRCEVGDNKPDGRSMEGFDGPRSQPFELVDPPTMTALGNKKYVRAAQSAREDPARRPDWPQGAPTG